MLQRLTRFALFSVALSLAVGANDADAQSMKMNVFIASAPPKAAVGTLEAATAHCYQLGYTMGASDQDWRAFVRVDGKAPEVEGGPWFNYRGEEIAATLDELLAPDADRSGLLNDRGQADPDVVPVESLSSEGTTGHFLCYAHPWS